MSSPLDSMMADMQKTHGSGKPDKAGKGQPDKKQREKDSKNEHKGSKTDQKGSKTDQKGSQIPEKQKGGKPNGGQSETTCANSGSVPAGQKRTDPEISGTSTGSANSIDKLQASIGSLATLINSFGTKLDTVNDEIKELKNGQDAIETQLVDWENQDYQEYNNGEAIDMGAPTEHVASEGEVDSESDEPPKKQARPGSPTEEDEEFDCFASLRQDCGLAEKKDPPVFKKLAECVNGIAATGLPDKAVSDRKAKITDIENVDMLVAPRLNECVWHVINKETRLRDSSIQNIQKTMVKGLLPIIKMADSLHAATKGQDMPNAAVGLNQLIEGIGLLVSGHHSINLLRRELVKPDLHKDFKSICSTSNPVTADLFGDELPKKLKEIGDSNRVGAKVRNPRITPRWSTNNYGGFRRGSSRGFRPHFQQYSRPRPGFSGNYQNNYRPRGRGSFLDGGSSYSARGRTQAKPYKK